MLLVYRLCRGGRKKNGTSIQLHLSTPGPGLPMEVRSLWTLISMHHPQQRFLWIVSPSHQSRILKILTFRRLHKPRSTWALRHTVQSDSHRNCHCMWRRKTRFDVYDIVEVHQRGHYCYDRRRDPVFHPDTGCHDQEPLPGNAAQHSAGMEDAIRWSPRSDLSQAFEGILVSGGKLETVECSDNPVGHPSLL